MHDEDRSKKQRNEQRDSKTCKAEEDLSAALRMWHTTFEAIDDGIFILTWNIGFCSAMRQREGYSAYRLRRSSAGIVMSSCIMPMLQFRDALSVGCRKAIDAKTKW